jgi:hypothetical protein
MAGGQIKEDGGGKEAKVPDKTKLTAPVKVPEPLRMRI